MMIKVYTKVHIPSNGHNNINHGDRDHVDDDSDHQWWSFTLPLRVDKLNTFVFVVVLCRPPSFPPRQLELPPQHIVL